MRYIFEVTMKIKTPQEDKHLQQVTYRFYNMTRNEAIETAHKMAGDNYYCHYVINGPRLDD